MQSRRKMKSNVLQRQTDKYLENGQTMTNQRQVQPCLSFFCFALRQAMAKRIYFNESTIDISISLAKAMHCDAMGVYL